MKTPTALSATLFLARACLAHAAEPEAPLAPFPIAEVSEDAGGKEQPKQLDKDKVVPEKKLLEPPKTSVFDEAIVPPRESAASFNPNMMGDFPSYFSRRTLTVFGVLTTSTNLITTTQVPVGTISGITTTKVLSNVPTVTKTPTSLTRSILVPTTAYGAINIAENESPRPQDRVFVTWNYYSDLQGPPTGGSGAINTARSVATTVPLSSAPGAPNFLTTTTTANTRFAATPLAIGSLNEEVFGFEKTFLDGRASVELRVPLLQQTSNLDGYGMSDIADLTIIGRYALLLDRETGNTFTVGMSVTAPTGPSILTSDGAIHSTLLQPWTGYIWNADRFFVQAFHSIVIPTDARDVTLLFNDVGVNYWLYKGAPDRAISFIMPMLEAHVTTPLDHRSVNDPIYVPDLVVLTAGVHVGIGRNATLSLGVATPVTAPRVFGVESLVQLNWRF